MNAAGLSNDLATARYSTAASTFLATWQGSAGAIKGVYYDGDFTVANTHGHHLVEFPFANEGDAKTEIVRQRFWQLASSFLSLPLGTPAPNNAALLLIEEENFKDEGGGIISWDRVYANIPLPRDVFSSFSYPFQYMYTANGTTKLAEQAFTVPSRLRCDYFHIKDLAAQEILLATRIIQVTDTAYYKRGADNLTYSGFFFVSSDPQIVAEDSTFKLWKYPIVERRTRYIAGPTTDFWGTALSLG